jgi:hypothetical protein
MDHNVGCDGADAGILAPANDHETKKLWNRNQIKRNP